MTTLSKSEIKEALSKWQQAWNEHNLAGVLELLHEDIVFESWAGATVSGKRQLRRAWTPWFTNQEGFRFIDKEVFIDEAQQKVLLRWLLEWPSLEQGYEARLERREGVDALHFCDGKILRKLTYSKTTVDLDGKNVLLVAQVQ